MMLDGRDPEAQRCLAQPAPWPEPCCCSISGALWFGQGWLREALLHGFSSNPNTVLERWLPGLRARLSDGFSYDGLEGMKILLPPAPVLPISCYGEQRPRYPAWHDYLSVGQAAAGTEEGMDVSQLGETRQRLHELLDTEIAALGDPSRVLVAGHSQGGCVACDLALTCE